MNEQKHYCTREQHSNKHMHYTMAVWTNTNKFGVAIWNYRPESSKCHRLTLLIGEPVHICEESDDWYHGYSLTSDSDAPGIFPKCYVLVQDYEMKMCNKYGDIYYKYSFEQETIFSLREWTKVLKQLYINGNQIRFNRARELITEIICAYQRFKSNTLTFDMMNIAKNEIIDKLDIGNKLLQLDLTVHNSDGFRVYPLEMSIIDYYCLHKNNDKKACQSLKRVSFQNELNLERSAKRNSTFRISNSSFISQTSSETFNITATTNGLINSPSNSITNSYAIWVSLSNFICTIKQDMDIVMAIYDAKENKFISENFVVKWDKAGLVHDIDKLNNIRVVFTDFSQKDLECRLFLVCQVIRLGAMNVDNQKNQLRKSLHPNVKKDNKGQDELRRPCGVAVYDLTDFFRKSSDYECKEILVPFVPYSEKDSLDSLIRKVTKESKESTKDSPKTQSFRITLRLIHTNYKVPLLDHTCYVARKIGFPDIIFPEDFRNDLYLTLVCGEFPRASERNIEVTVRLVNKFGAFLDDRIDIGADRMLANYRSVVYYHEERPKWMETIKVSLSIEEFCNSHLKFTFKHRSSNENKDKNEKPFAMAFIPLMNNNGTTLGNREYELIVYKVDGKKYNDTDISYLDLPHSKAELETKLKMKILCPNELKQNLDKHFPTLSTLYSCSTKDSFTVSVVVCSTKLAQNINIFGLLNWKEKKNSLEEILKNVEKLDGGDVVKFLYDTLDALFEIWMEVYTPHYNQLVFCALVQIIRMLLEKKYCHFQPILNDYIERHFSATLIYAKLIDGFKYYMENAHWEQSYHTVRCMEYICKFIVRSRTLFAIMNGQAEQSVFECSLESLLQLFSTMMCNTDKQLVKVKSGILKYFPHILNDLITVYEPRKLSAIVVQLLHNIPLDEFCIQKLACIHDIIYTELFTNFSDCRRELLPVIDEHLKAIFFNCNDVALKEDSYNERLNRCLHIVRDVLIRLHGQENRLIRADISELSISLLEPMVVAFVPLHQHYHQYQHQHRQANGQAFCHHLWSIIITLLYQMSDYHYNEYFHLLNFNDKIGSFLLKLLKLFQFGTKLIYPSDWSDMNLVQNIVILKTTKHIVGYMRENADFKRQQFDVNLWNEIFLTSIAFVTQESLQLENFSKPKRKRIEAINRDMRLEMSALIRSLWYLLGGHKKRFIPTIIGPLLEMALLPVLAIRHNTITIFFDMICLDDNANLIRNEVITKMDSLITIGKGDHKFRQLFESAMKNKCENHPAKFKEECLKFVDEIGQQIEKLLIYREVVKNEDSYEYLMSCIIDLLDFYDRIERREMYIRYLYKLYDLHIKYENFNEAAYTLAKHCILLQWSDVSLESLLRSEKHPQCNTHRELKEKLYYEMIENFNRGQLWEVGILHCKQLIEQYENVLFDYAKLSQLLTTMSSFYSLIVTSVRLEPEYFHVTYYGNGFPVFFRGKSFIYRGKAYERLVDFTKRLQSQFPNAKLLEKLDQPEEELSNTNDQYLAIFRVEPVFAEAAKSKFSDRLVNEKIYKYYQFNEIHEFIFSRRNIKNETGLNEFACMWIERSVFRIASPLPGVLCRSEVVNKQTYELNPLQNAIDTMEKVNDKTRDIILRYLGEENNANPLHIMLMHINGIVNSDVQGGIAKYEEAFFQPVAQNGDSGVQQQQYDNAPEELDKLKELIAAQIPLLQLALKVVEHKQKQTQSSQANMDGLYKHILDSFHKMRDHIEEKYGKRCLPAGLKKIADSRFPSNEPNNEKRLSNASAYKTMANNDNNRQSVESSDGNLTLTKSRMKQSKLHGSTANLTNTLRFRKNRRNNSDSSNSIYASSANISQSQWYTDASKNTNGNLSYISDNETFQDLTTTTAITATVTKSNSRPSSGHYNNHRASIQSHLSLSVFNFGNSSSSTSTLSIANQVSLDSQNDEIPPPLPAKKSSLDLTRDQTKSENLSSSSKSEMSNQMCQLPAAS